MRCPHGSGHDVKARRVTCWSRKPFGWIAYYCPEHHTVLRHQLDEPAHRSLSHIYH